MESKIELERNPEALKFRVQLFTVSFIILALICIWVLTIPFRITDNRFSAAAITIVILAVVGLMLGITTLKKKWDKVHYFVTDNAIIVTSGSSSFKEDVYRFDSIISASIRQTKRSRKLGYGDIILRGPHLKREIVLQDINEPAQLVDNIHQKLAHNSTNPTAINQPSQ